MTTTVPIREVWRWLVVRLKQAYGWLSFSLVLGGFWVEFVVQQKLSTNRRNDFEP